MFAEHSVRKVISSQFAIAQFLDVLIQVGEIFCAMYANANSRLHGSVLFEFGIIFNYSFVSKISLPDRKILGMRLPF